MHDMSIRQVVDEELSVSIDIVAQHRCIALWHLPPRRPNTLRTLKGLRIAGGLDGSGAAAACWPRKGCTHLTELLSPLATVAFQTLSHVRKAKPAAVDATGKPRKIDTCYAYASDREVVHRLWPMHYDGLASAARPRGKADQRGRRSTIRLPTRGRTPGPEPLFLRVVRVDFLDRTDFYVAARQADLGLHDRRADGQLDEIRDAAEQVLLRVVLAQVQRGLVLGFGELLAVEALLPIENRESPGIQHPYRDIGKRRDEGPGLDRLVLRGYGFDSVRWLTDRGSAIVASCLASRLGEDTDPCNFPGMPLWSSAR